MTPTPTPTKQTRRRRALRVAVAGGALVLIGAGIALAYFLLTVSGNNSAAAQAGSLSAPTSPTATVDSQTQITVGWTPAGTQLTGAQYSVVRTSGPASPAAVCTVAVSTTSCADTGLTAGTAYGYSVTAVLGTNWQSTAITTSATTLAANGSGTMSVSPTATVAGSIGNTLTFSYTPAAGGTSNGVVTVTVPTGWNTTPQTSSSSTAGYTTASGGSGTDTVTITGSTIKVSGVTLTSAQSLTITYGAGGGSAGVTAATTTGTYTFAAAEASVAAGTITNLGSSPTVTVTPGALNSFTLTPSTSTPTAGTAFTVSISAFDAFSNADTSYTGSQCLTFAGPSSSPNSTAPTYPATGTCASGSAVTFSSGVATGANAASITLYDAQTATLTATDNPTTKAGSTSLTVAAAAAATTSPSAGNNQSTNVSTAFSTSLAAKVTDTYGNGISGKSVTFTAPTIPTQGNPSVTTGTNSGTASGSGNTTGTAALTVQSTTDGELAYVASAASMGGSAPAATPSMTNLSYTGKASGSALLDTASPPQASESWTFPKQNWGTLAIETNPATATLNASGNGTGTSVSASAATTLSAANDYVVIASTISATGDTLTPSWTVSTGTAPTFTAIGSTSTFDGGIGYIGAWYVTGGSGSGTVKITMGKTSTQAYVEVAQLVLPTLTSGSFSGTGCTAATCTATTNSSGVATAGTLTADASAGTWTVSALAASTTTATFNLANTTSTASLTASPNPVPGATTVTLSGSGFDASATLSATVNGSAVTLTGGTTTAGGAISGTTFTAPSLTPGTYLLVVTDNGTNKVTASTSLSILAVGYPQISNATAATFAEWRSNSFTFSASGTPSPTISNTAFSGCTPSTLPGTLSFTGGTGTATISGTPTAAAIYTLCITATNTVGTATQTFTLTVFPLGLNAVSALSNTQRWAVGYNCTLLYGTGTSWVQDVSGAPASCISSGIDLQGVTFPGASNAYAVGSSGTILICTANCTTATATWTQLSAGTLGSVPANTVNLTAVSANATVGVNNVLVVGNASGGAPQIWGCSALCNNGSAGTLAATWTNVTPSGLTSSESLSGASIGDGTSATHSVAVGANGSNGFVVTCSGTALLPCTTTSLSWAAVTSSTGSAPLTGVFVEDSSHMVAVGNSGVVITCTASCQSATGTWSAQTNTPAVGINLTGVMANGVGNSSDAMLIVGNGGFIELCTTTCTGTAPTWTKETSNTTQNLIGVGGGGGSTSFTFAFAVGQGDPIATSANGSTWVTPTMSLSPTTAVHATGTSVTPTASGFSATATAVSVSFDGGLGTVTNSLTITSGTVSGTFTSPTNLATPGTYLVIVSDGKGNAAVAIFTLT